MKTKSFTKKLEVVFAIVLVILIAIGIWFFLFRNQQQSKNTENISSAQQSFIDPNTELLTIDNPKQIIFSDIKLNLPDGWSVATAQKNTESSIYECDSGTTNNCTIYTLMNGDTTYYLSTPVYIVLKDSLASKVDTKDINISGANVTFRYAKTGLSNITLDSNGEIKDIIDVPDSERVIEVYGCTNNKICFNSGALSTDQVKNQQEVANFENFLSKINFN